MPVEAQSAACAVLIKSSIKETMISLHFRLRGNPAHIETLQPHPGLRPFPIKAAIKETMISAHFRLRDSPAHI